MTCPYQQWFSLTVAAFLFGAAASSPAPVLAHGGHSEAFKVRVIGDRLQFDTHIGADTLLGFDDNHDGKLGKREFFRHVDEAKAWLQGQVRVRLGDGAVLEPVLFDLPVSEWGAGNQESVVGHVHLILHYRLPAAGGLQLQLDLRADTDNRTLLVFSEDGVYTRRFGAGPIHVVLR